MRLPRLVVVGFFAACVAPDDGVQLTSDQQVVLAPEADAYSGLVTLTDAAGQPLRPVHVNLTPDGRVLLIGRDGTAGLLTPSLAEGNVQLAAATPDYEVPTFTVFGGQYAVQGSLFCSGHTQLATGEFFSVGGTRLVLDFNTHYHYIEGLPYGTRFDGSTWKRTEARLTIKGPSIAEPVRWYPRPSRPC